MSESASLEIPLARTFDLLVPAFADFAFVHLTSPAGLAPAWIRHRDEGLEEALAQFLVDGAERMNAQGSPLQRTFSQGAVQVSHVGPNEPRPVEGPAAIFGPRSYLTVPVGTGRDRRGVLTLGRFETEEPFGPRDRLVAESVADQLDAILKLAAGLDEGRAELARVTDALAAQRSAAEKAGAAAAKAEASAAGAETLRVAAEKARVIAERNLADADTKVVAAQEERAAAERAQAETEASRSTLETSLTDAARALAKLEAERDLLLGSLAAALTDRDEAVNALEEQEKAEVEGGQPIEALLLNAVDEAVIATDLEGRITHWNRAAERLLGWSQTEVIGRHLGDTAPAVASRAAAAEGMGRIAREEVWSGQVEVEGKDGTRRPVSLTGMPIQGPDGEPIGLVAVYADLAQQKTAEVHMLHFQRAQTVGRVAAAVARGFDRYLTTISGGVELIRQDMDEGHPALVELKAIETSSRRAAVLMHRLNSYSRGQVLPPRVVSMHQVVTDLDDLIDALLGEDVEFSTDLRADPDTVWVDPGLLEQVVTNLVLNAGEASTGGGTVDLRTDTVTLGPEDVDHAGDPVAQGLYVAMTLVDEGEGMTAETLERALDPSFTTKPDGTANGLGLSTVHRLMKESNGYLWLESSPSSGTTVRLAFPTATKEVEDDGAHPGEGASHQRLVLLIEDDATVRDLARGVLEEEGHEVLEARTGRHALALWAEHGERVDLVVSDVMMPRMSGRALVDRLRTTRPKLPALFLSGYTDDTAALQGITEGRDPFLGKPISSERLSSKVEGLLAGLTTGPTP